MTKEQTEKLISDFVICISNFNELTPIDFEKVAPSYVLNLNQLLIKANNKFNTEFKKIYEEKKEVENQRIKGLQKITDDLKVNKNPYDDLSLII